ncbi:hypothetical protein CAXC1_330101 [Candidatus Xenohaliotis californiensis]|uniref:HD domain-containing protein n=1 Tax=Candidatus Xenohaliotis californiensis TaxID=84677 RepID=A0ABP0EWB4_9RICK|nr:hypothetical protein CAXC1_330101 [Candidatus Xenohaliotis californiensis]
MGSKFYDSAVREIFHILNSAPRAKYHLLHARNVLQWVEKVARNRFDNGDTCINVDDVLKIAALGHDIECALPGSLHRSAYQDYVSYRQSSHKKSGGIIADIMQKSGASEEEAHRGFNIVKNHEQGASDFASQLLCDADALSYCDVLITFEHDRYLSIDDIAKKIHWECHRMSTHAFSFVVDFHYACLPKLNSVMHSVLKEHGIDTTKSKLSDKCKISS